MTRSRAVVDLPRIVGAVLGAHFVFACTVKIFVGTPWQLLWFCHVSLALAAVGFATKSTLLRTTALTNVLVLHSLWIVDFVAGYTTGTFPFSFSEYVRDTTLMNWFVSLHHLYLLPLLLWSFIRDQKYPKEAWLLSATLFVLVMLASRGLLSPVENVNYAYYIPDSVRLFGISMLNQVPGDLYLFAVHGVANVAAFLPAAVVLTVAARLLSQSPRPDGEKDSPATAT